MKLTNKNFLIKNDLSDIIENIKQYFLINNLNVIHWAITDVDNEKICVNATVEEKSK